MDVQHNANFLYGQSVFSDTKVSQKYVTRYLDRANDNKTMINNQTGECATETKLSSWPLNSCNKRSLLAQTNQSLEFYSDKTPESLSCDINVKFMLDNSDKPTGAKLLIDDINHFKHFYYEGYLLNLLNLDSGIFVFKLNADMKIIEYRYFKDTLLGAQQFLKWQLNNPNHLLDILKTGNKKKFLKKLAINLDHEDMDIQVLQYFENSLKSRHALNLDDSASLTTCF